MEIDHEDLDSISYKDKPLEHAWSGIVGCFVHKLFLHHMHMYSTSVESRTVFR